MAHFIILTILTRASSPTFKFCYINKNFYLNLDKIPEYYAVLLLVLTMNSEIGPCVFILNEILSFRELAIQNFVKLIRMMFRYSR